MLVDRCPHDLGQTRRGQGQLDLAGLQVGEGEQVAQKVVEGFGRILDAVHELPLTPAEAPEKVEEPEFDPADASPTGLRILVVEDNPTNRKVAELMLSALGAKAECVENGQLAVEAVRGSPYDIALMDLQMPVMDGLSAIRAIRGEEADSGRPRLPIVVVSANVAPEQLVASRVAGADGHIGKPIRTEELIAAIAEAVNGGSEAAFVRVG